MPIHCRLRAPAVFVVDKRVGYRNASTYRYTATKLSAGGDPVPQDSLKSSSKYTSTQATNMCSSMPCCNKQPCAGDDDTKCDVSEDGHYFMRSGVGKHPLYERYPLDPSRSEIRLLELVSDPQSDEPLRARLHVVSLLESPEYCALSYVWGAPKPSEQITIILQDSEEILVGITQNLAIALNYIKWQYLRYVTKMRSRNEVEKFGTKTLKPIENCRVWADSLCINQADLREKETQISMMCDIYKKAQVVFGSISADQNWSDEKIRHVFKNIALLYNTVNELNSRDEYLDLGWIMKYKIFRNTPSPNRPGHFSSPLKHVADFFRHTYFRRLWILQEICLARELVLFHGEYWLPLEALEILFGAFYHIYERYRDPELARKFIPQIASTVVLALIRSSRVEPLQMIHQIRNSLHDKAPDSPSPAEFLQLDVFDRWTLYKYAMNLQATNPKDYIYGLRGLTGQPNDIIYDNDRLTLGRLYAEHVTNFMKDFHRNDALKKDANELTMLSTAGLCMVPPSQTDNIELSVPSWAPALHFASQSPGTFRECIPASMQIKNILDTAPKTYVSLKSLELTASGIELGRIAFMDAEENTLKFIASTLSRENEKGRSSSLHSKGLIKVFFQAVTMGKRFNIADPLQADGMLTWLVLHGLMDDLVWEKGRLKITGERWMLLGCRKGEDFKDWFDDNLSCGAGLENITEQLLANLVGPDGSPLNTSALKILLHGPLNISFEWSFRHGAYERGLFITDREMIGSCPLCAKEGDTVVFFKGGDRPFVIRMAEDQAEGDIKWLNVGPCFLPELETGEMEKRVWKTQRFTLI